jgi:hypothetical protein
MLPRQEKSSPLSPHHRFVIAFRSPKGIVETGLLTCPSERMAAKPCPRHRVSHFLQSGFRASIAKFRRFPAFLRGIQSDFSALQTVWRRGRDSNLRYSFVALSLDVSVSYR